MKIISLCEEAVMRVLLLSIKNKYNSSTNFFDYIIVDMNTINKILLLRNINNLMKIIF